MAFYISTTSRDDIFNVLQITNVPLVLLNTLDEGKEEEDSFLAPTLGCEWVGAIKRQKCVK